MTGTRKRCRADGCGQLIQWVDNPTGGWWAHDIHPADGHDADTDTRFCAMCVDGVVDRDDTSLCGRCC